MHHHNGDNESVNDGGSDDEQQRGYADDLSHLTSNNPNKPPSQDLFYKNGGRSHDSLAQTGKYRTEGRSSEPVQM